MAAGTFIADEANIWMKPTGVTGPQKFLLDFCRLWYVYSSILIATCESVELQLMNCAYVSTYFSIL